MTSTKNYRRKGISKITTALIIAGGIGLGWTLHSLYNRSTHPKKVHTKSALETKVESNTQTNDSSNDWFWWWYIWNTTQNSSTTEENYNSNNENPPSENKYGLPVEEQEENYQTKESLEEETNVEEPTEESIDNGVDYSPETEPWDDSDSYSPDSSSDSYDSGDSSSDYDSGDSSSDSGSSGDD